MTSSRQMISELEAVVDHAASALRRHRAADAVVRGLPLALRSFAAIPLIAVLLVILGWIAGYRLVPVRLEWVALVMSVAPLAGLGFLALRAARQVVSDDLALATVDRELGLEDRLLTAAELLRVEPRTPFMQAALDDAARFTHVARERRLALARSVVIDRRNFLWIHGALVLLALLAWLPTPPPRADVQGPASEGADLDLPVAPKTVASPRSEVPLIPRPSAQPEVALPRKPDGGGATAPAALTPEMRDDLRTSRGMTASGRSADAAAATGASDSKGSPSNQSQTSTPSTRKPTKKPRSPGKRPEEPETPAQKQEEESGSTAGRGSATGSNKSPAASRWASKDQVTSEEELELEDDEDVDDEIDENEARGGVQPGLRDRKPPVNRDLTIGFGNMKNPDANGRGGPGDQKKSRGVATLVLGVPIPDHVKGRPNPGRTKITQERVQPEAEEAAALTATSRDPRRGSVGPLDRPALSPWMRRLVRDWFLSRHPSRSEP